MNPGMKKYNKNSASSDEKSQISSGFLID